MYQLVQTIANNPEDLTKVDLIFANVTEGDIFLKPELDKLAAKKPEQITIHYKLDKAPKGWKGKDVFLTEILGPVGHVNESLLKKYMPRPSEGKVFVCGPPGMMNAVSGPKAPDYTQGEIGGMLKKMGYKEEDVFKF
jgi:cytochrome-b5 reductase